MKLSYFLLAGVLILGQSAPSGRSQGARIAGWTLTEDGSGLGGVEVILACPPNPVRRTVSDENGRFELADVAPGNCRLRAIRSGYVESVAEGDPDVRASAGYNLKIADGAVRNAFELRLRRAATVVGRITDPAGNVPPDFRIHLVRREVVNGRPRLHAESYFPLRPPGTFEHSSLPPGEYYVGVSPAPNGSGVGGQLGYATTYFPGTTRFSEARSIPVKPGESARVEFTIGTTGRYGVSGTVFDWDGRPVAGAAVGLSLETDPHWISGEGRTDESGRFLLMGVQPGAYVLGASKPRTNPLELGEISFVVDRADVSNLMVRIAPRR